MLPAYISNLSSLYFLKPMTYSENPGKFSITLYNNEDIFMSRFPQA